MLKRAGLSVAAAAVLAGAVMPVGLASEAFAAGAKVAACKSSVDGTYCGYYSGSAYTDRGDAGAKVREIQALLIHHHGYSVGSKGVDGYFGSGTESAVKRLQRAHGAKADGIVGANTWGLLRGEPVDH
ncbi:peptidoglycan-binding domain-containing protein [Streptomyces poriferorum]|uniref:Peptidoglycan-binding domain-containing protein n=1 Tax=Streptomyces poriferorum TaxID=2798799 RepID=A0ABY9J4Y1_9ACTN|nr:MULTISPECIES: peptidoglycan-binding domain-containing protein [unclassified Streptomyces]MDP5317369.1 peptidoglycan-binding domain-containing protein [Streptomyces sp. Alt4]WLQ62059.1 peptidoglycan-binding domain-containing protein [Streptomyces sp. Alt2]